MSARAASAILDELSPTGWFARQPPHFRRRLLEEARTVSFAKGAWIYGAEEEATGLFALLEGGARVYITLPRGGVALVDLAQPGAWFGQVGILRGGRRQATAMAAAPTRALLVPRQSLQRLLADTPAFWESFAALDVEQMQYILRAHAELLALDPRARVAGRLIALTPRRRGGSVAAPIALTQSDLAELVGLERKTVQRILAAFARSGWVRVGYGVIEVLDAARLARLLDDPQR
jgi:CRP/FNR family cyclic AMP-dependent transcriptional regulator